MIKKIGKKSREKSREPEPSTYFIGSEGTKTEVIYFGNFAKKINEKYVGHEEAVVIPFFTIQGIGTSNFRLISDIDDYLRLDPRIYENIWAVFDLDDIPLDYFDNSIKSAESKGYKVAWTNDSIELWYLLHLEFLQSAIDRKQYSEKLTIYMKKAGLEGYEKNDPRVFKVLYPKTTVAIKNAKRLEAMHGGFIPYSKRNPATSVHHLVQELVDLELRIEKIKKGETHS